MPPKLGILAGGGELPLALIAECRKEDRPYFVIALKDQIKPEDVASSPHAWFRLGAAGKIIARLRAEAVEQVVMAGSVKRPSLVDLRPDFWALSFFIRTGVARKGDNSLLDALIRELEEREGFEVIGAHDLLPDTLATAGNNGQIGPDETAQMDINAGWAAALDLGRKDIGQAVVARDGALLATEDASGTAEMLKRLQQNRSEPKSGVLVKVSKPGQNLRADMPAIGPDTITQVSKAGLAGIAIEAGKTLILRKSETLDYADKAEVFIYGLSGEPER